MTYEELENRVSRQYASVARQDVKSLDPMTIAIAIQLILAIVQQCVAKRIKEVSSRPILMRVMIRRRMSDNDLSRAESKEIVETIAQLATGATENEINEVARLEI